MLLVCLKFVGGCAGSTAGGMKIARIMVVFKVAYQETYRVFRPQARMSVRISGSAINEEVVRSILVFFCALYSPICARCNFYGRPGVGSYYGSHVGCGLFGEYWSRVGAGWGDRKLRAYTISW